MVDSVAVKPIAGTGTKAIVIEKVGDEYYPRYKLAIGEDGEAKLVGEDNPLPVSLPNLTHETDVVTVLNEISRKLSVLIEYEGLMHKVNLEEKL